MKRLSLVLMVAGLLVMAQTALAHALLLRSTPEANAAVDSAPAQVELLFSESLDGSFSRATVLDSTGKTVDNGDSRVDPADLTRLTVSLPSLPDGVYTVSWKVLSAVDGHVTSGAFPFAVGNVDAADLAAAAQASRQVKLPLGEVLSRWMSYLAVATLAGGQIFVLLVWQPARDALAVERTAAANIQPPFDSLAIGALALLSLANVIALLVQGGQVAGGELAAPWSAPVAGVLFQTRYGSLWLARFALILAIGGWLARAPKARERWLALGASGLLLLTISLGSHAAADPDPLLPIAADWVHMLAASAWVGGLLHFVAALWAGRNTRDGEGRPLAAALASRLLPRFSAVALMSVGTLVVTGLYMAVLRLGSIELLFGTLYGRTLIVKLALAAPMVGMGAVNLLWTTPRMRLAAKSQVSSPVAAFLRKFVTSELSLGVAVFLAVGLLTSLPPGRTTATASALRSSATADDLSLAVQIEPGRVGLNTFKLELSSGGQALTGAKEVLLRFTPAQANLAPSEARLQETGIGVYTTRGAYFSLPDNWQVQAVVRRKGQFDAFANFNFDLSATAAASTFPWHRVAGGLVGACGLLLIFALRRLPMPPNWPRRLLTWTPAVAMLAVGAVVYYLSPAVQSAGPVNPIPPNSDSVAIGQALYQENCLPCHGPAGKGDGPVGLTLNPRPADLSAHAVPGVHSDGQLFEWISNGFPGSVMPAFTNSLTEDQHWHIINYLRERLSKGTP